MQAAGCEALAFEVSPYLGLDLEPEAKFWCVGALLVATVVAVASGDTVDLHLTYSIHPLSDGVCGSRGGER